MIPIPWPDKDSINPTNDHPIALTSCIWVEPRHGCASG